MQGRNQPIPTDMMRRVIYDSAYVTFQEAVQSLINRNPGMEEISQLALVFHFTKQACKLAQAFGRKANSIKENSINYIGHKFAAWIDSQGGWVSLRGLQSLFITFSYNHPCIGEHNLTV